MILKLVFSRESQDNIEFIASFRLHRDWTNSSNLTHLPFRPFRLRPQQWFPPRRSPSISPRLFRRSSASRPPRPVSRSWSAFLPPPHSHSHLLRLRSSRLLRSRFVPSQPLTISISPPMPYSLILIRLGSTRGPACSSRGRSPP